MSISVSPDVFVEGVRGCVTCGAVYRKDFRRCANDGRELEILAEDPLIGREVGPYMVASLLGEGAMGRVYRVHHRHLIQKQYALKVLLGDLEAVQSMRMRFEKEAELASRLAHPNVVSVVDVGRTAKGLLYLAMELVEGRTLADELAGQPMHPARVVDLSRQIASGLAHAHELGLIHRDLKPENVMVVDRDGGEVARIADFGLAITRELDDARLTDSGFVIGTAAYMAPEQCSGVAIDHRADLYALGVAMFEMLTGGLLPFTGSPPTLVGSKVSGPAPSMAAVAPHIQVPPALAEIVAKLLSRRRSDRFTDAGELIAALDRLDLEPAPQRRDDTVRVDDQPRPSPRRLVIAAGAALVVGVAVAIVAGLAVAGLTAADDGPALTTTTPAPAERHDVRGTRAALPTPPPDRDEDAPEGRVPPARTVAAALPRVADRPASTRPVHREVAAASQRIRRPKAARVTRAPEATVAIVQPATRAPVTAPTTATTPEPPPAAPPPPPPPPKLFAPHIQGLQVAGSLSPAVVRRGLARVAPALAACTGPAPLVFDVQLTIGETRRATGARGGDGSRTASCVIAALSEIRTDASPDVGDATVRVRVALVERD